MRNHTSLIILIISILIVAVGYFAYQEFIYPSMLNNASQERNLLLSKDQQVTLVKKKEQTGIYSLEVEIEPNEYNYSKKEPRDGTFNNETLVAGRCIVDNVSILYLENFHILKLNLCIFALNFAK